MGELQKVYSLPHNTVCENGGETQFSLVNV